MDQKDDRVRKLYEDALYWHLISKGYSTQRAKFVAVYRTKKFKKSQEKSH